MKPVTPSEQRALQLRMLNIFADFCEEHHLRYSLGGGTLLGAVRHQGFIPWDDDIDVMMPRPDYEYFLKEFTSSNISITHGLNTPGHPWLFAKMYDDRTYTLAPREERSVFIDIFPVDAVQTNDEKLWDMLMRYPRYLLSYYHYIFLNRKNNLLKRIYNTGRWLASLQYHHGACFWRYTQKRMISNFHKEIGKNSFGSTPKAGAIVGLYHKKEVMPTSVFEEYTTLPFEGRQYMCIQDYDAYLRQHYGNYMQLPPEHKRRPVHQLKAYWK